MRSGIQKLAVKSHEGQKSNLRWCCVLPASDSTHCVRPQCSDYLIALSSAARFEVADLYFLSE
jgi:hypothetical protein